MCCSLYVVYVVHTTVVAKSVDEKVDATACLSFTSHVSCLDPDRVHIKIIHTTFLNEDSRMSSK